MMSDRERFIELMESFQVDLIEESPTILVIHRHNVEIDFEFTADGQFSHLKTFV